MIIDLVNIPCELCGSIIPDLCLTCFDRKIGGRKLNFARCIKMSFNIKDLKDKLTQEEYEKILNFALNQKITNSNLDTNGYKPLKVEWTIIGDLIDR